MASCVVPVKRKADEDAIRCICGLDYDDGFSIACDACSRWCHAACFNIVDGAVPEEWLCWLCNPRPVDSDTTRTRIQRQREVERQRRRSSPGIERKARRPSTVTDEPSTHAYVPIAADIVHPDARARLHRHAHHWRGVSALASPADNTSTVPVVLPNTHNPSPTTLRQIPPAATSPDVRPPTYAVHTAAPVPSDHLITPFTSSITPSSAYLADPLNAYAHLGMPKPFVHLIGPPLDIALDARITGDSARFVRSGCRPNAVLRPVLCPHNDSDSLSFGVFALRDLKANEEVVLGWEWDDGNAIHSLPALIEAPHTFPHPSPSDSPHQVQYLRNQMSNILHALSSTFTTCACGSKTKTCVVNQMAAFVDDDHSRLLPPDNVNLGPLVGKKRGFRTRERLPFASGLGGVEMCDDSDMHVDPLPNFVVEPSSPSPDKGKGKAKSNGLLHNDIIARPTLIPRSSSSVAPPRMQRSSSRTSSSSENNTPLPEPDPPDEDRMPPKMRKRWKREIRNRQRESASYSPAASLISHGSTDPGVETTVGLEICIEEAPSSSKVQLNNSTQSPFQPWAPFERKAQLPLQAVHQEDKMDVDIDTHTHTPSARSPQTSISPRSRSRSPHSPRQHLHPSPTSTAITTPPSPREPKLPDVIPLSPPPSQRPIADSPESPPNISIDTPSPMTPIIPIPPEDHQSEDEMQIDETEDERQITPPPRPLHPELTPSPPPLHPPKSPSSISFSPASPSPSPPPYSPEQIPPLPELEPLQRSESPREPTVTPTFTPAREASRTPTPTPAVLPRVESEQALGQTPEPQSTIEVHPETERASTPTPVAPEPDASPSTPQPQTHAAKVKLSLKDFAARKKKMQKEVGGGLMSADASPRVGGMAGLGEKGGVLAVSPSLGVKELGSGKDLVNEGLVAPARPASVGALTSSLFGKGFSTKVRRGVCLMREY
ncbi:hypothetical protein P691DRAFT_733735 [Macrolepiota fuliginosa MF-IS2]|uniref:PHD-type domain-containing protein n=1 Tax=Macrolepiota fuliginosa MF-IS2 TaxID=1400762 RepID=A0A9P5X7S7_9AGAR|nr:hypothetical protein P691DRAFT_733735 [Macrolepiota fuliginosa MF-IS2]